MLSRIIAFGCLVLVLVNLTSCFYQPPYNNFQPQSGLYSTLKDTRRVLLKKLYEYKIEVVHYGDQVTLIVPTDQYFEFNSDKLIDRQYKGLEVIVKFIRTYPKCPLAVAAFSDNVDGTKRNLKLTDKRANAMVAFLWANGIAAKRLVPQGFGEHYDVADNHIVRGRALNRRLEIQWPAKTETLYGNIHRETASSRKEESLDAF
ncbi:MAG: hypothetical protein A3F18_04310 [Legionellales bacterium RIFCSPHIGHO2_12_FULL_37_14]|nr:MAG: hypothetical protein A3F18_04310 [Legionellales bacterium RIFCSPHIGHO2_12_FULL_37_14]